jgi:hypothetical protein
MKITVTCKVAVLAFVAPFLISTPDAVHVISLS